MHLHWLTVIQNQQQLVPKQVEMCSLTQSVFIPILYLLKPVNQGLHLGLETALQQILAQSSFSYYNEVQQTLIPVMTKCNQILSVLLRLLCFFVPEEYKPNLETHVYQLPIGRFTHPQPRWSHSPRCSHSHPVQDLHVKEEHASLLWIITERGSLRKEICCF